MAQLAALVGAEPVRKPLELFLMLPEPRVMGSASAKPWAGARRTVLSPARETSGKPGIETYSKAEFDKLGVSWEKFLEKAQAAAEKRLAALKPEFKQGPDGSVLYAVYRSDKPTVASLLIAPSLAKIFERIFGPEVWVVAPDRYTLYVFPSDGSTLAEFATDLKARFEVEAFVASDEIFSMKADGSEQKALGSFTGK